MGLYIPGTTIRGCGVGGPIGCGCPCYNWYDGRCQVVNKDVGDPPVLGGFPDFCPIVHVQSPHGDLIDRDAARGSIKPWSPEDERSGCTFDTVKKLMHTMLDRAPTIIESEEGEA